MLIYQKLLGKLEFNKNSPALVLGMFETGLGVVRSLGHLGINVCGFDFKKDIAFYSKYVKAEICPHPLLQEKEFITFMITYGTKARSKPVVFITSDIFLTAVSRNRELLLPYFLFNLPSDKLIVTISNKYKQYKLADTARTPLPVTIIIENTDQIEIAYNILHYPVLIKALDVNEWREKVSGSVKGFVADNSESLYLQIEPLLSNKVKVVVQEIIEGPDTNHFKYCAYYSSAGTPLCEFTLRKIRQNPIHFGVGAVVESIHYDELMDAGRKLFRAISYNGVGSAEFKLDKNDGQLKLIEINPRYWQQNYLPTACGMNFPLVDYLATTGQRTEPVSGFKTGIKWVNLYMDFDSFLKYRKEKTINFRQWLTSLKGEKVYSDFSWDDLLPGGYELRFGLKILKIPIYILKRLFSYIYNVLLIELIYI